MNVPGILQAYGHQKESDIVFHTELTKSLRLSEKYKSNIHLKREDLNCIRIFKLRGVYNKMIHMSSMDRSKGVVTASDGNHAQAVAFCCHYFKIKGYIFLPEVCFNWKIDLCKKYGKDYIEIVCVGINFFEAHQAAEKLAQEQGAIYIHPFDDEQVIEGHATMAIEILQDMPGELDYLFIPVGGGGLAAGVSLYFKAMSPKTKVIGVQPDGAASMIESFKQGKPISANGKISRFCDGSAVPFVGNKTFGLCQKNLDQIVTVPEGRVSTTVLDLYTQGIAVEPAGALSVAVLEQFAEEIKGKRVCCIVSGGTVDLSRFDEFKELSLLYEGLKYFFLIQLPLKPGILKSFVTLYHQIMIQSCLGPDDEITAMQFHKKNNRERGPVLVSIEVTKKENVLKIMENMDKMKLNYKNITKDSQDLYDLLV